MKYGMRLFCLIFPAIALAWDASLVQVGSVTKVEQLVNYETVTNIAKVVVSEDAPVIATNAAKSVVQSDTPAIATSISATVAASLIRSEVPSIATEVSKTVVKSNSVMAVDSMPTDTSSLSYGDCVFLKNRDDTLAGNKHYYYVNKKIMALAVTNANDTEFYVYSLDGLKLTNKPTTIGSTEMYPLYGYSDLSFTHIVRGNVILQRQASAYAATIILVQYEWNGQMSGYENFSRNLPLNVDNLFHEEGIEETWLPNKTMENVYATYDDLQNMPEIPSKDVKSVTLSTAIYPPQVPYAYGVEYKVGDYVYYGSSFTGNNYYICITAIPRSTYWSTDSSKFANVPYRWVDGDTSVSTTINCGIGICLGLKNGFTKDIVFKTGSVVYPVNFYLGTKVNDRLRIKIEQDSEGGAEWSSTTPYYNHDFYGVSTDFSTLSPNTMYHYRFYHIGDTDVVVERRAISKY